MKILNKICLAFVVVACAFLCSCSKKVVPVVNSLDANEKLDGSWKRQFRSSMDLYSNPEDPDSLCGEITTLSSYTITFNTDLSYSMAVDQVYESFLQTAETVPYTEEDFKNNFTDGFVVYGTYAADDNKLQLTNKNVVLRDGTEMTAEEYSKYNPAVGTGIIESKWKVEGNKFTVIAIEDENVFIEYRKVK